MFCLRKITIICVSDSIKATSLYYIPSFLEIDPPVSEKIFEGFLPYMGVAAIFFLGHVTSIMSSDFHFLVPESFHKKFSSDRHSSF